MTRALGRIPSRRDVLRSLAGAGIGISALGLPGIVDAKKHRKKKGKKKRKTEPQPQLPPLVFNQFGCIEVGQPCRGDSALCCSGICQGAAPNRRAAGCQPLRRPRHRHV